MKSLISRIQRQYNKKIKFWRTDNTKEFINDLFQNLLKYNHIEWEHISLYVYYQSSIVKRAIQIVIDKIRILIIETQLLIYLWMELAKTAVYLKNRSPTKLLLNTTSWESLYREKSDFSNLRIIRLFVSRKWHLKLSTDNIFNDKYVVCGCK
jgi:hypothetical protein